jgi:hypothetical protein
MKAFQAVTITFVSVILGLTIVSTAMIMSNSEGSILFDKTGSNVHFNLERK